MELVTGIDLTTHLAHAQSRNDDYVTTKTVVELGNLHKKGLPRYTSKTVEMQLNLQDLTPCPFEEYAYACSLPEAADAQHQLWSLRLNGQRFLIPALAIMRGLIGNHPQALERLFLPQSLDDICDLSSLSASFQVKCSKLVAPRFSRNSFEIGRRLTWFSGFPSARTTWASAYLNAREGRLSLTLPRATLLVRLDGHGPKGNMTNFYVTAMYVRSLRADEAPFDFATNCPREFEILGKRVANKVMLNTFAGSDFSSGLNVLRPDSQRCLSDAEWAAIRSHLSWLPQEFWIERDAFDAALRRMFSGATWKVLETDAGVEHGTFKKQYMRWKKDGRLEQLLDILRRMRGSQDLQ